MQTIHEPFTDEEYKKIRRIKNAVGLTWHDFLLKICELADTNIRKELKKLGKTPEEIEAVFVQEEPCAAVIAREARDKR